MPAGHARRSGSGCSLHPDDQKSARTAAVVEGNILNIRDATGIAEKVQHVGFAIEVSHNARLAGRKLIHEIVPYGIFSMGDAADVKGQCGAVYEGIAGVLAACRVREDIVGGDFTFEADLVICRHLQIHRLTPDNLDWLTG